MGRWNDFDLEAAISPILIFGSDRRTSESLGCYLSVADSGYVRIIARPTQLPVVQFHIRSIVHLQLCTCTLDQHVLARNPQRFRPQFGRRLRHNETRLDAVLDDLHVANQFPTAIVVLIAVFVRRAVFINPNGGFAAIVERILANGGYG